MKVTTGVRFKGEALSIEVVTDRNDLKSDDVINAITEARRATRSDAEKGLDLHDAVHTVAFRVAQFLRTRPFPFLMVKARIVGVTMYAEKTVTWDDTSDRPMAR